jgi:hypothetical protein
VRSLEADARQSPPGEKFTSVTTSCEEAKLIKDIKNNETTLRVYFMADEAEGSQLRFEVP